MSSECGDRSGRNTTRWTAVGAALILFTGCSGSSESGDDAATTIPPESTAPDTTASTTATTTTTTAPDEPADGLVGSWADVESATIRIETTGTYVEPGESFAETSEFSGAFTGSGFIIDPAGIAVTNHHVVTGAATVEVYLGDDDEPINARVLGLSECSDLAVIDLDGEGYPFLDWYDDEVEVGLEVRLAGFPQGTTEYTMTSGIVSKAEADGELPWASIDHAIEHDAAAQPGNSGGPLVAEDGRVVGVHFGHGQYYDSITAQFWAISADLAEPLVGQLAGEADVEALGVNGTAFVDGDSGTSGIWVSSVETGSPAAGVGLAAGDVIERLEGLPMGVDGTLLHYCNVLQSHLATDEMAIQVYRPADGVRLRGVLNGEELEPIASVTEQVDEIDVDDGTGDEPDQPDDPDDPDDGVTVSAYTDYVTITDDAGALEVQVPVEWADINGDFPFQDDDDVTYGLGVEASPDIRASKDTWTTPWMGFSAMSDGGDNADLLQNNLERMSFLDACSTLGPQDYADGFYTGVGQAFTDCDGTDTDYLLVAAMPPDGAYNVFVQVQVVTDADVDALDRIIQTFIVTDPDALGDGEEPPDQDEDDDTDVDESGEYTEYREVTDRTGAIQVEVPTAWTDVGSGSGFHDLDDPTNESKKHGIGLLVSPDNSSWTDNWGVPGVYIAATSDFDPAWPLDGWLDERFLGDCTVLDLESYADAYYTGISRTAIDCGESDTTYVDIVAIAPDESHLVAVLVTLVTDADVAAYNRIIDSFLVVGDVPD